MFWPGFGSRVFVIEVTSLTVSANLIGVDGVENERRGCPYRY
jgi:hypothetical protein